MTQDIICIAALVILALVWLIVQVRYQPLVPPPNDPTPDLPPSPHTSEGHWQEWRADLDPDWTDTIDQLDPDEEK